MKLDKNGVIEEINKISSVEQIENLRIKYLGKKGLISLEMKSLASLSIEDKKIKGQELNNFKFFFEKELIGKKNAIEKKLINEKLQKEKIDTSLPPRDFSSGKIHPISQTMFKIIDTFGSMGFAVKSGPDIESDFNNFSALNIPDHHPAREMQDTFYIDDKVLRTHTSPVQVRTMLESKPPIRIIVPGRTYRSDSDSTHTPMFHQVEGLLIDNSSTMAHLKGCLIDFLQDYFEINELKYRFRPSYFPFTEPSAEMDIAYTKKDGVIKFGEGDEWVRNIRLRNG
jgi:Phenylalanyl-tRNA synthetase alpha subunit